MWQCCHIIEISEDVEEDMIKVIHGIKKIIILGMLVYLLTILRFLIICSGSMEPKIPTGSIVIVTNIYKSYDIGDVITYKKPEQYITHRIVSKLNREYITKGDANRTIDLCRVKEKDIIGKVIFVIPFAGYVLRFVKTYLFLPLLLVVLLIWILKNFKRRRENENKN